MTPPAGAPLIVVRGVTVGVDWVDMPEQGRMPILHIDNGLTSTQLVLMPETIAALVSALTGEPPSQLHVAKQMPHG